MALPVLDSMFPAFARGGAAAAKPAVRLGYVYTPNGIIGCNDKSPRKFMWTPTTAGANFEFSPTMKSLEPFREHVIVFSGLAQVTGRALGDGPGDHARATATWLTGVHPYKTGGADFKLGISADQIAAQEFGKHTQLASLELGARAASRSPATATRATPARTCRCRGAAETSPLPGEINPRAVFERLFGDGESTDAGGAHGAAREPEERARLRHRQPDAAAGHRSAPATSGSSTNTSNRCATSSGAFSAPKSRTSR